MSRLFIIHNKSFYQDGDGTALAAGTSLNKCEKWIRQNYPAFKRIKGNEKDFTRHSAPLRWFENAADNDLLLIYEDTAVLIP